MTLLHEEYPPSPGVTVGEGEQPIFGDADIHTSVRTSGGCTGNKAWVSSSRLDHLPYKSHVPNPLQLWQELHQCDQERCSGSTKRLTGEWYVCRSGACLEGPAYGQREGSHSNRHSHTPQWAVSLGSQPQSHKWLKNTSTGTQELSSTNAG